MNIKNVIKTISKLIVLMQLHILASGMAMANEQLIVYTVNYPLQYFAQRIAGSHARVVFPAPANVDPAFWQPDIDTIIEYQQADVVLLNGAGYAHWAKNVSLPVSKLVNTSESFNADYIDVKGTVTHSHGPASDHSHAGTAFTIWLDFTQALAQARAIRDALVKRRPALDDDFKRGFEALEQELLSLDAELMKIIRNNSSPVFASHPVYQYLTRRYGLNLKSVTWEPDELPPEDQWTGFQSLLVEYPAQWMLWEDDPNLKIVMRLKELGIEVVVFNPCANIPGQGNFMSVMRENLQNLKKVARQVTMR